MWVKEGGRRGLSHLFFGLRNPMIQKFQGGSYLFPFEEDLKFKLVGNKKDDFQQNFRSLAFRRASSADLFT